MGFINKKQCEPFAAWLKKNRIKCDFLKVEKSTIKGLRSLGIVIKSRHEYTPFDLRLYASEMVMRRQRCNKIAFSEYYKATDLLILYAEYLEQISMQQNGPQQAERQVKAKKETRSRKTDSIEQKELNESDELRRHESLILAYFLSRCNERALSALSCKNYREAFDKVGVMLNQKPSTIKNMRDEFDPYFDNGRAGWHQRQLRNSRKDVFDSCKNLNDDELIALVYKIVDSHTEPIQKSGKTIRENASSAAETKRARIVIGGAAEMKEIKTKKQ